MSKLGHIYRALICRNLHDSHQDDISEITRASYRSVLVQIETHEVEKKKSDSLCLGFCICPAFETPVPSLPSLSVGKWDKISEKTNKSIQTDEM